MSGEPTTVGGDVGVTAGLFGGVPPLPPRVPQAEADTKHANMTDLNLDPGRLTSPFPRLAGGVASLGLLDGVQVLLDLVANGLAVPMGLHPPAPPA